jgi:hypothetical protein
VLRIPDTGSEFFPSRVPDQKDSGSLIRIVNKELKYLTEKMFIPDPDLDFLPIPDPGVKTAPDPGSSTLVGSIKK